MWTETSSFAGYTSTSDSSNISKIPEVGNPALGLSSLGVPRVQISADQLTLSQPRGTDYAPTSLLAPRDFQTFLRPWALHMLQIPEKNTNTASEGKTKLC